VLRDAQNRSKPVCRLRTFEIHEFVEENLLGEECRAKDCKAYEKSGSKSIPYRRWG
jgi:hypothetical protein